MYIVIFEEKDEYFGPFETETEGEQCIIDCNIYGRIVSLVKPYAFGKLEPEQSGETEELYDLIKRIEDLEAIVDNNKLQSQRDQRSITEQSAYENRRDHGI